MSGYVFVNEGERDIDKYGVRVDNDEIEDRLFIGKVIYEGRRYIGRYRQGQHGTCYIAVGNKEVTVTKDIEILQYRS